MSEVDPEVARATRREADYVQPILNELLALRVAVATHLRYLDGEVVEGLRSKRHTREVVANIAEHQSRNLRQAVERTGGLLPDGTASPVACRIPDVPPLHPPPPPTDA